MSAQLLGPTPLQSVIATSVSADQRLTVGPFSNGTVSLVETASVGGATLSLADSSGATASIPLVTISSSGGPPITAATISTSAANVAVNAPSPATTGLRIASTAGSTVLSAIDSAGAGSTVPVLTITSTGGPPINGATASFSCPVSFPSTAQSGLATIPLGAATIAVALPPITANSVVLFSPLSAPDATCIGLRVVTSAGVGFSLTGAANATAAVPLAWFVAKY
jgi:hypothetical protein